MGSITTTLLRERHITIKTIEGPITLDDLKQWVKELYSEDVMRNTIWDFRKATIIEVKSKDMERIFKFTKNLIPTNRRGKTALVVSTDFAYGLSKLYKTHHDLSNLNVEHQVFKEMQQALEWIEEGE